MKSRRDRKRRRKRPVKDDIFADLRVSYIRSCLPASGRGGWGGWRGRREREDAAVGRGDEPWSTRRGRRWPCSRWRRGRAPAWWGGARRPGWRAKGASVESRRGDQHLMHPTVHKEIPFLNVRNLGLFPARDGTEWNYSLESYSHGMALIRKGEICS